MDRRSFLALSSITPLIAKPSWMSIKTWLESQFGITSATVLMGNNFSQWETVYKVVTRGWQSASYVPKNIALSYELGEITYPKVGKIFVFKNYEDAQVYKDTIHGIGPILKAKAKNVHNIKRRLHTGELYAASQFWNNVKRGEYCSFNYITVSPTINNNIVVNVCDYIKPIKIMED